MAGIGKAGEPKFQSMGISENCQLIVQVSEELAWGIRALKGEAKCGFFTLESYPFWLKGKYPSNLILFDWKENIKMLN